MAHRPACSRRLVAAGILLFLGVIFTFMAAVALGGPAGTAMQAPQAALLGAVEGITEFLPISSTAHLLITERLLGIGGGREALEGYAIVIQGGAILAVAWVYGDRLARSGAAVAAAFRLPGFRPGVTAADRRLALGIVLAAAPAAVVGLAGGDAVQRHLYAPVPIALAWAV
ncbi:MAG: undecaprenyl-diphosphate phosphatase, partial [Anaerolineales bacterium]